MKKIIALTFCFMIALCSWAQEGLHVKDVFEGNIVGKEQLKETFIKGEMLASYRLSLLRTIKFTATEEQRKKIEQLVEKDIEGVLKSHSDNCEMERRNNHLYYAIVQLPDQNARHRYLCFQGKKNGEQTAITLVYMEGSASLTDLKKTFKK